MTNQTGFITGLVIIIITIVGLMLIIWGVRGKYFCLKGSGLVISQDREIAAGEEFSEIELRGSGNIYLTAGKPAIHLEAEDNLIDKITTEINDNKLIIKHDTCLKTTKDINIFILEAFDLMTNDSTIVINGSGQAQVNAAMALDITIKQAFIKQYPDQNFDDALIQVDHSTDQSASRQLLNINKKQPQIS